MSVFENVQVALMARDDRHLTMFRIGARFNRGETQELLALVGLAEEAGEQAGELAYGKQKQLELAIALAERHGCSSSTSRPRGCRRARPRKRSASSRRSDSRNLTLLFTEHDMTVVFGIADRITVLHNGGVIASGAPETVRGDPRCGACISGRGAMAQLELRDVHTAYGQSQVLFGVSFAVEPGECIALIGRNGVGKTTTIRSIAGLVAPRRGAIEWLGENIAGRPSHRVAKLGIGYVPEERRISPS